MDRPAPRARVASAAAAGRARLIPAAVPVALLGVLAWTHRWVADDAFINFRIVDQILHGNGPVFNAGERVEAATSTLWLWMLWLADAVLPFRLEWIAVILGLALALAGLAAASYGALILSRSRGRRGLPLPLGALVFAVLPPVWDFTTSGLETGLSFGWLGFSFLALVLVYRERRGRTEPEPGARFTGRRLALVAVLFGLGPLVRPDFLIFSIAFTGVLVAIAGRPVWKRGARLIGAAVALPLAYELFRMGYYASIVPNTASAKEASGSYWSQGLRYLGDLLGPYWLWLPLAALLAWLWLELRDDRRHGRRWALLVTAAPVAGGLLETLFVVKVGGDFMHARMLLPALFAVLMPVMVVPVERARAGIALAAGIAAWALVCGVALRTSYAGNTTVKTKQFIVDERSYYIAKANGPKHPITLGDYSRADWARMGFAVRDRAARGERMVTFKGPSPKGFPVPPDMPERPGLPQGMVAAAANIGLFGYAAGPHVWVVDRLGLGDPVAARLKIAKRNRPGHEKLLPPPWVLARFGDPRVVNDWITLQARRALTCRAWWWNGTGASRGDQLPRTLDAISAPLTVGRFFSDVKLAATSGKLRIPPDPVAAAAMLCGPF